MNTAIFLPTWNRLDYLKICLNYHFNRTNYPHRLLVKRIFCLYPRKVYEQFSGILEWSRDGVACRLDDEPTDWCNASDAMIDRKNIPSACLDTGITKEDEEEFLKQWGEQR